MRINSYTVFYLILVIYHISDNKIKEDYKMFELIKMSIKVVLLKLEVRALNTFEKIL